jgi:hypothetical protein
MRPYLLRSLLPLAILAVILVSLFAVVRPVSAAAGIFESYIVLNGTYYDVNANTSNPDFPGEYLGTFSSIWRPLTLNGGEIKTFKNNGTDISIGRLQYRVYPVNGTPGNFTAVTLPFAEDLGGNDQRWAETGLTIDLLDGLADGYYEIEIYFEADTNGVDADSIIYDSAGGANYKATFGVGSARALWLDATTIAWNGASGSSYRLLYDPDGGLVPATAGSHCLCVTVGLFLATSR